MKVTLVISTYNSPRYLALSLDSVFRQSRLPDEVVIADDGSSDETSELIARYAAKAPFPIVHQWQEDDGFRKTIIMNRAIAQAKGDYIIQIDGDIIMHRDFVKDHLTVASRGCFVCGSRVLLSKKTSDCLLSGEQKRIPIFVRLTTINCWRVPQIIKWLASRYRPHDVVRISRGCNMAFWRSDFISVNGYDENFEGWGLEDTDLVLRLYNSGLKKLNIKLGAVEYHINHLSSSRDRELENQLRVDFVMTQKIRTCDNGVGKYIFK